MVNRHHFEQPVISVKSKAPMLWGVFMSPSNVTHDSDTLSKMSHVLCTETADILRRLNTKSEVCVGYSIFPLYTETLTSH
jgi:hypothetical protein